MKYKNISLALLSAGILWACGGGGGSTPPPVSPPEPAALDFRFEAPSELSDYEAFSISVTPLNLKSGETVTLSLIDPDGTLLFPEIEDTTLS
ncbi:MAG: hypothetical protein ACPGCY_08815, partial [Henriciella sp.]